MKYTNRTKKELIEEILELSRKIDELNEREEASLLLLQNPNSIILKMNVNGKITFVNDFALNFFGYTEEEILDKNMVGTILPSNESSIEDTEDLLEDIIRYPELYRSIESENICQNEQKVWVTWTYRALTDSNGGIYEIICIGNDITRQKYVEEELKKATQTDLLTGLSTRKDFVEKFEHEKYRFSRNNKPFSLVLCKIMEFKDITDIYGPDCGDYILKKIADIFKKSLRKSDVVGRWAGEEFILLFPETNLKGSKTAAEKIHANISSGSLNYQDHKLIIPINFCVCLYDRVKLLDVIVNKAYDCLEEADPEESNKIYILQE